MASVYDLYPTLDATLAELAPVLTPDRDARVVRVLGDFARVEMDDEGNGEFGRIVTDSQAAELVRLGLVRDARE